MVVWETPLKTSCNVVSWSGEFPLGFVNQSEIRTGTVSDAPIVLPH